MNHPIRIGVVGCGDIAETYHIPTIHACPEARIAALCDTKPERAERLAAQYGVSSVASDYRELLRDPELDAVVVATPPWITPHVTMDFLRAGKDVLCEKPMAVEEETCKQVMETEKETGRKVQVGFTYRHGLLMETLRKWIRDGRLGSPLIYRIGIFDEIWDPVGNPGHYERIRQTMEHGSPSVHDGAHVADWLQFLTDSAFTDVEAFGLKTRTEFPASNYDAAIIRFANGDVAKVEIGWMMPVFPRGEFEVIGSHGLAIFDRFKQVVKLRTAGLTETVRLNEDWKTSCFRVQLQRFISSIRLNQPCVPGSSEGLNSLRLGKRIESVIREAGAIR